MHLYLTQERFTLHQKSRDLVKSKKCVKHVYDDENCLLKVKFENNKESIFSSISEFLDLTDQGNNPGVRWQGHQGDIADENL